MLDDFNIPDMPENEDDAAAWVRWFGQCMQMLINLIKNLFGKVKELTGETTAPASEG